MLHFTYAVFTVMQIEASLKIHKRQCHGEEYTEYLEYFRKLNFDMNAIETPFFIRKLYLTRK